MNFNALLSELIEKAIETNLITSDDRAWAINSLLSLLYQNDFTYENTEEILEHGIGNTFARVLADAGVYKDTPKGRERFLAFLNAVR